MLENGYRIQLPVSATASGLGAGPGYDTRSLSATPKFHPAFEVGAGKDETTRKAKALQ
jgi:hypothetical protein